MALEDLTGTKYIDSLNSSNPTATDGVSEGDDHIRGIKNVLKTTFPNVSGAVTSTHTELNLLDGVTATTSELNRVDGTILQVRETLGIYSGYVDSLVAAEVMPTGWTVARPSTGTFTITHGLGLSADSTDELFITVTPIGDGSSVDLIAQVDTQGANSFQVLTYDISLAGLANIAFYFTAIKVT